MSDLPVLPVQIYYSFLKSKMTIDAYANHLMIPKDELSRIIDVYAHVHTTTIEQRLATLFCKSPSLDCYDQCEAVIRAMGAYSYRQFAYLTGIDLGRLSRLANGKSRIYHDELNRIKAVTDPEVPTTKILPMGKLPSKSNTTASTTTTRTTTRTIDGLI